MSTNRDEGLPDCCLIMLLPVFVIVGVTVAYYWNTIIEPLHEIFYYIKNSIDILRSNSHSPWLLTTIGTFLLLAIVILIVFFLDIFLRFKGFTFRQRLQLTSDTFFHSYLYAYSILPENLRTEELTLSVLNHMSILSPKGVVILEAIVPKEHWSNIKILSRFFTISCTREYKLKQWKDWVIDIPEQTYESGGGYTEHVEEEGHWKEITEEGNFLSFYNNRPAVTKYMGLPISIQQEVSKILPWYLGKGLTKEYVSLIIHGTEVIFYYYGGSDIDENT